MKAFLIIGSPESFFNFDQKAFDPLNGSQQSAVDNYGGSPPSILPPMKLDVSKVKIC
jgi:hypothetical protein